MITKGCGVLRLTYNIYDGSVPPPLLLGTAKDMTEEAKYCLSEGARCYRLARGCFDKKLIEIGAEFAARAMNLGADPLELP